MRYLTLLLHGTFQSWGGDSSTKPNAQSPRTTETLPTLGAVYGIIRAAMGDSREYFRKELYETHVIIRGDRLGSVARDYQVATRSHHGIIAGSTVVTPKMNIQDATFVVLIGHEDDTVIDAWAQGLLSPVWAPFIGRRAHVPSLPMFLGVVDVVDPLDFLVNSLPVMWGAELGDAKRVPLLTNRPLPEEHTTHRIIKDIPIEANPRMKKYKESVMYRKHFPVKRALATSTITQYRKMVAATRDNSTRLH